MAKIAAGLYLAQGDHMNPRSVALAENGLEMSWTEANQSCLVLEFARLRSRLGLDEAEPPREALQQVRESMEPPPAIDTVASIFELSPFERDVLLLCAGIELDSKVAARCAEAMGRSQRGCITFSLALATLADPHWNALAPLSSLRRYRLIEMEGGEGLTSAPLRIDERILHFIAGVNRLDIRLEGLVQSKPKPDWAADEHRALAWEIATRLEAETDGLPVIHLCGDDASGQEDVAALLAHHAGRQLFVLRVANIPAAGSEAEQFIQLWTRESLLLPALLLLQLESAAPASASRQVSVAGDQLIDRLPGPVVIASRDRLSLHRPLERHLECYEVNKPGPAAQKRLWQRALGPAVASLNGHVDNLAEQFRLSAETIFSVARSAVAGSSITGSPLGDPPVKSALGAQNTVDPEKLWNACRIVSRPRLEDLAERIGLGEQSAGWDDLILPDLQKQILHQLASQLRHRMKVYETWGFAARGRRGLGLSALFSGPSGTGKTMAAEVLAGELKLDLYRIDLSAVVSKYIGETEKNLKQVFDAAECGGVLLLFDEADALFGKRAEVKDSRDRYANIEVGYLLQRMESFEGLAILTTNLKSSLDKAFQRRLRFIVDFPFPDAAQREAIWARIFPGKTPTHGLDLKRLSQLNMTGGNIRNIALNAAFLAAEAGKPVEMDHVLQATRLEAVKSERPLSEIEIRGWV
jgi:hypothetical protein